MLVLGGYSPLLYIAPYSRGRGDDIDPISYPPVWERIRKLSHLDSKKKE